MGHRCYVIFVLLFPTVELVTLGYTTHSKVNKIDGDASRLVKQGIIYNGVNLKIPRSYSSKYNRYYGLSRNQMVFFTSVNRSYFSAKKYNILKRGNLIPRQSNMAVRLATTPCKNLAACQKDVFAIGL